MALTIRVDVGARHAEVTHSGVFTGPDVQEIRRTLITEGVGPGYTILADLRRVQAFASSGDEIRSIAADREGLPWVDSTTKIAIVAPPGEVFGLARIFESARFPSDDSWFVCRSVEEAQRYLYPHNSWPLLQAPVSASVLVVSQDIGLAELFIRRMAKFGLTGVRVDDIPTAERVMQAIVVRAIVWTGPQCESTVKALAEQAGVDSFALGPDDLDTQIEKLLR